MLELYHALFSTCSQKVRICLAEKGLEWTDHRVNLGLGEHLTPEYLALNPNGVVPTLVDDGQAITDSSVICEYLDERYPGTPLSPEDLTERARMRAWMRYFEEVPTPAVRIPSFNLAFLTRFENMDEHEFRERVADRRTLRKQFYLRMGTTGFSRQEYDNALEQIERTCERVQSALGRGPWLLGERYTIADICLFPSIDRMADLGLADIWARDYPRVTEWHARMLDRPAVQEAYPSESRVSELFNLKEPPPRQK